jgi:hypothetical protein
MDAWVGVDLIGLIWRFAFLSGPLRSGTKSARARLSPLFTQWIPMLAYMVLHAFTSHVL